MTIKYVWKELTSDGLLREPDYLGAYYESEPFNGWGGYDNEEEAVERLKELKGKHKYMIDDDYVLVKIYQP